MGVVDLEGHSANLTLIGGRPLTAERDNFNIAWQPTE